MKVFEALNLVSTYLAVAMLVQAAELLILFRKPSFLEIWKITNLLPDLNRGLPIPRSAETFLFSEKAFAITLLIQIIAAITSLWHGPQIGLVLLLFVTHLLICIRFRGSFNGGSDMMTFVLLSGLLISLLGPDPSWGLLYIGIHTFFSYFKAGIVKLREKDWRSGRALSAFLSRSLYPRARRIGVELARRPKIGWMLSWGVILFELSVVLLVFFPKLRGTYFALAVFFHFMNYWSFGLNRFFWVWLAAWPALLWGLSLISVAL